MLTTWLGDRQTFCHVWALDVVNLGDCRLPPLDASAAELEADVSFALDSEGVMGSAGHAVDASSSLPLLPSALLPDSISFHPAKGSRARNDRGRPEN